MFEKLSALFADNQQPETLPLMEHNSTPHGLSPWYIVGAAVWIVFSVVGVADIIGRMAYHAAPVAVVPATQTQTPEATDAVVAIAGANNQNAINTTPVEGLIPARLVIPSINVDAKVVHVGTTQDGAMGTPGNFVDVAWYEKGPEPGQAGNAVIDGHVNNALGKSGVFEHLDKVGLGDRIKVSDASGRTLTFIVQSEQVYPADNAPTGQIFSRSGQPQLALITCDGAWDNGKKEYNKRLVVYAALAQ